MTNYTETQTRELMKAIILAAGAHKGQQDKAGVPMIFHVLRVANSLKDRPELAPAAVLHDVVEDSRVTLEDLVSMGYSPRTVELVDRMTRRLHETYQEYLDRLAQSLDAMEIKKADLVDNMDPDRQSFDDAARLLERHARAYGYLLAVQKERRRGEAA